MICVPIVAHGLEKARGMLEKVAGAAEVVELRLDLIGERNWEELLQVAKNLSPPLKVIVTYRGRDYRNWREEEERIETLLKAVERDADFVDVEEETAPYLLTEVRQACSERGKTELILSHHDFTKTPSFNSLRRIEGRLINAGAHIVKIVTFARVFADNLTILRLLTKAYEERRRMIAFCMGDLGIASRVLAPAFGSFVTFAALEKGAESAPGQLTVRELREAVSLLRLPLGYGS